MATFEQKLVLGQQLCLSSDLFFFLSFFFFSMNPFESILHIHCLGLCQDMEK